MQSTGSAAGPPCFCRAALDRPLPALLPFGRNGRLLLRGNLPPGPPPSSLFPCWKFGSRPGQGMSPPPHTLWLHCPGKEERSLFGRGRRRASLVYELELVPDSAHPRGPFRAASGGCAEWESPAQCALLMRCGGRPTRGLRARVQSTESGPGRGWVELYQELVGPFPWRGLPGAGGGGNSSSGARASTCPVQQRGRLLSQACSFLLAEKAGAPSRDWQPFAWLRAFSKKHLLAPACHPLAEEQPKLPLHVPCSGSAAFQLHPHPAVLHQVASAGRPG